MPADAFLVCFDFVPMLFVAKVVERQPALIPLSAVVAELVIIARWQQAVNALVATQYSSRQLVVPAVLHRVRALAVVLRLHLWRRERDEARQRILAQGVDAGKAARIAHDGIIFRFTGGGKVGSKVRHGRGRGTCARGGGEGRRRRCRRGLAIGRRRWDGVCWVSQRWHGRIGETGLLADGLSNCGGFGGFCPCKRNGLAFEGVGIACHLALRLVVIGLLMLFQERAGRELRREGTRAALAAMLARSELAAFALRSLICKTLKSFSRMQLRLMAIGICWISEPERVAPIVRTVRECWEERVRHGFDCKTRSREKLVWAGHTVIVARSVSGVPD